MAKKRKLITRRRLKWAGVFATTCIAATLVASYWYWPSYSWARAKSSVAWGVNVEPCGISLDRREVLGIPGSVFADGWRLRTRQPVPSSDEMLAGASFQMVPTLVWFPTRESLIIQPSNTWHRVKFPLWLPLLLIAAPTAWLWFADRRAKPWQCASCRYDLRGLESEGNGLCPECGKAIGGEA